MKRIILITIVILMTFSANFATADLSDEIYESAKVLSVTELDVAPDEFTDKKFLVELKLLDGPDKGQIIQLEHALLETDPYPMSIKQGDKIILFKSEGEYYVHDYKRDSGVYVLIFLFIITILWVGRWQGVKTVITLFLTLTIIAFVHIPLLNNGLNPILVTIVVATIITVFTLFFIAGVSRKSVAAIIGTLGGVVCAGALALIFAEFMHVTGLSNDEALMLKYIPQGDIFNASELLLSGIILGALGAVMDVAMSIASSIEEIRLNNPDVSVKRLFRSGMNIGRDVMGTMTNTLILAYTGSFLPLILLFNAYRMSHIRIMNMDLIAAEVVRALSGSIGIVMCIPITAFVAVQLTRHIKKELPK